MGPFPPFSNAQIPNHNIQNPINIPAPVSNIPTPVINIPPQTYPVFNQQNPTFTQLQNPVRTNLQLPQSSSNFYPVVNVPVQASSLPVQNIHLPHQTLLPSATSGSNVQLTNLASTYPNLQLANLQGLQNIPLTLTNGQTLYSPLRTSGFPAQNILTLPNGLHLPQNHASKVMVLDTNNENINNQKGMDYLKQLLNIAQPIHNHEETPEIVEPSVKHGNVENNQFARSTNEKEEDPNNIV